MIRSYSLNVILLLSGIYATSLVGMTIGAAPAQQNRISEAIFRDATRGGLIAPALLALCITELAFNKKPDNPIELLERATVGFTAAVALPVIMKCLGNIFDIQKGNPTYCAYVGRNVFKCGYGLLVLFLMLNASDVVNGITSRAG